MSRKNLEKFEQNVQKLEFPDIQRMREELADLLFEQPELNTEFHIRRFLHACNHKYEAAFQKFRDYLHFRNSKNMKRIAQIDVTSERIALLKTLIQGGHYGLSKDGHLVVIERVGHSKYAQVLKSFKKSEIEDYIVQLYERLLFVELPVLSEVYKRRVDRCILIIDLSKFGYTDILNGDISDFFKISTQITNNYYPELLERSILVNPPALAEIGWKIAKGFLDKKTAAKFSFVTEKEREKVLTGILDKAELPLVLGGTNATPISEGHGPFMEKLRDSWARKSLFLADRSLEYKWFYTDAERETVKKPLKRSPSPTRKIESFHTFNQLNLVTISEFSQKVVRPRPRNPSAIIQKCQGDRFFKQPPPQFN